MKSSENRSKVTAIVTCYNTARYLRQAVQSVLDQTHRNLECLIIDDGSRDETSEIAAELCREDSRVQYFRKENGGPGSARNYGFERATGDWIQTLDGDDWIAPDKIERQLKVAAETGAGCRQVLVYSDYEMVFHDGEGGVLRRVPVEVGDLTREEILAQILGRRFGGGTIPISTNSILYSRDICERHRFDETMTSSEDLEFYYRILQEDIHCVYVPMCSMSYRQNADSISKDVQRSNLGYTEFLERVLAKDKDHLRTFPNLARMFQRALRNSDRDTVNRLWAILFESAAPVYLKIRNRNVNVRWLIVAGARLGQSARMERLMSGSGTEKTARTASEPAEDERVVADGEVRMGGKA